MNLFSRASQPGSAVSDEIVSTSQAAALCQVTRFTIRNWILENKLQASQTAGGHHRILRSDLVQFMKNAGIRPSKFSPRSRSFLYCWEYFHLTNSDAHKCSQCLVFKEQANRCFLTVREFGADKMNCGKDCSECAYMENYFPEERAMWKKLCDRETPKNKTSEKNGKHQVSGGGHVLVGGLYKSGKYVAALKNIFSGGGGNRGTT